jgi:hypothetical protein
MQDQQDIQNVKTWQAPQLMELGDVAQSTENGPGVMNDGGSFSSNPSS